MTTSASGTRANVFGVSIDAEDMSSAVDKIFAALPGPPGYVCLAGAHGVVETRRNPDLARAYCDATLVLPDGMPTVWIGHSQGFQRMDRVFGPDLMLEVFQRSRSSGQSHFLFGGQPGVAEELAASLSARVPGARVVGTYTPPFREMTSAEREGLCAQVAACRPDFFWVGVSTPKQELFMREFRGLLATKMMIGVGAAFDFHTGRLSDSPRWVKRAGLQWLHRLIQDPRRLARRYLRTNTIFLALWLASQFLPQHATPAAESIVPEPTLKRPVTE